MSDLTKQINEMVRGWLVYARGKGIATPESTGKQAEDTDVLEFITFYLSSVYDINLTRIGLRNLNGLIDQLPTAKSDKDIEYLNRIKKVIQSLSNDGRTQLRKEISNA